MTYIFNRVLDALTELERFGMAVAKEKEKKVDDVYRDIGFDPIYFMNYYTTTQDFKTLEKEKKYWLKRMKKYLVKGLQPDSSQQDREGTKKRGKWKSILRKVGVIATAGLVVSAPFIGFSYCHEVSDGISLEKLSEDPRLLSEVDLSKSTILPTEDIKISQISFENPDNGISYMTFDLIEYVLNGGRLTKVRITDDSNDIENLSSFLKDKGIEFEAFDAGIENNNPYKLLVISLEDFSKIENDVLRILKLNRWGYQDYLNLILNNIKKDEINIRVTPYEKFWSYVKPIDNKKYERAVSYFLSYFDLERNHKTLSKIMEEYNKTIEKVNKKVMTGEISTDEAERLWYQANEKKLHELIKNGFTPSSVLVRKNGIIFVDAKPISIKPSVNETENKRFKELFLKDMSKIGYFDYIREKYVPTEKFKETAKKKPRKLLEDMLRVIEQRMSYDYEKARCKEDKEFKYGLDTYEIGKGTCIDYATIIARAWDILQEYSPELRKIDMFVAVNDNMNHAWNGIKFDKYVTYIDPTWDDIDEPIKGNKITDISAVDKYHSFAKKSSTS